MTEENTDPGLVRLDGAPIVGGKSKQLICNELAELTAEDVAVYQTTVSCGGSAASQIKKIRDVHHQIARMLAAGFKNVEISQVTGITPQRVTQLKNDPAFIELLEFYRDNESEVFADLISRIKNLSTDALDKLHERIVEDPNQVTTRELIEVVKAGYDRSGHGPQSKVEHTGQVLNKHEIAEIKQAVDLQRGEVIDHE